MFIRNTWYVGAWSSELETGTLLSRKLLGDRVMLMRKENGDVVALEDKCPHRFAPLSCGQQEGDSVRCMYHGLVFNGQGECVEMPGQEIINKNLKVRHFPACERDGLVWLWFGDPTCADVNAIHRIDSHDSPDWQTRTGGYMHYKSNYQLITDNLLDFSHLAFVHKSTIGTGKLAEQRPKVERAEDHLKIDHWAPNTPCPPFAKKLGELPEMVDRTLRYTWFVHGCIFDQTSVIAPADTGGFDSSTPEAIKIRTLIAITPETENSTHYFWSTSHNNFLTNVSEVTDMLRNEVAIAFEEDRQIIEAQQSVIDESGDHGMNPIPSDSSLMQVRWMVNREIEKEKNPVSVEHNQTHVVGA